MNKQFQEVFDELYTLPNTDKIKFLDNLLFYFTIAGRAIWSDEQSANIAKIEAFKWLNELTHRVWNLRSELQQKGDSDSVIRLYENVKYYGEQSDLLRTQLVPTTLGAYNNFKEQK